MSVVKPESGCVYQYCPVVGVVTGEKFLNFWLKYINIAGIILEGSQDPVLKVPKFFERHLLLESMGPFIRYVYRVVLLFEYFSMKFPQKGPPCL